jgi:sec-independent protein translocase protein TatA
MPNIGPMEVVVVLVVALLILGPKKLPDVGRSVGKGIREFKDSVTGNDGDEARELHAARAAGPAEAPRERDAA